MGAANNFRKNKFFDLSNFSFAFPLWGKANKYEPLSLNKFFDPSTPYFDQSEASKYKMAARGPQNCRRGYWAFRFTFAK